MELTPELQEKKRLMIDGLKKTYKVQYDAVQPIPYIKDRLYCVDKVFVEGGVEVCLASELTRDTGGLWERLESYKNIYTKFRLNSKRLIIQGEPGYGKSTLTLQLAYDWCNDVWNSSMRNVEILILLRLRQLGGIQSIYRAIKLFLLADERQVTLDDIKKIIQSCSSVNIILDGYDEYPNRDSNNDNDVDKMIVMELFQTVDVTVTTRYLPKSLKRETKRAKLTGFDEKARDEYIRKAVVGDNEEAVEQIKRRLYENSVLADLCQVPLIFVMFAHITHDPEHSMRFTSVTQFFKYMIRCFHEHLKRKFKDTRNNNFHIHETKHHELDKIAFEGLNKRNQQLSWNKILLQQRVGQAFYEQYISIGILIEEQIVSEVSKEDTVVHTTEVRFYHKLFCEWYAAHHLVTLVKNADGIDETLRFLDPFDLQYLFRFACGLDPDAGKKLINHLKRLPGGDTFAILCILEQTGDVNDVMDSVKELCSRDVNIKRGDSALLQRSTTQLLEIASNNNIPISCVHLEYSSIKFEGDTIILHSGISLPTLPTVEKIHIAGSKTKHENRRRLPIRSHRNRYQRHEAQSANQEILTVHDILNLFHYGMKCGRIKELMFVQLQLPTSVSPKVFTDVMKTRNIQVLWRPFDIDFHLDLQNGQWEVEDNRVLENIRFSTVSIDDRVLQQISTVQLLHVAHRHNLPISSLLFSKSFKTAENATIILNTGIRITNLTPLQKIHDVDNIGCNAITEQDIANILKCVMKGQHFNDLCFEGWLMPFFLSSAFTNWMLSLALNVSWRPFDNNFRPDLQTGHWEVVDNQVMEHIRNSTVSIDRKHSVLQQRSTVQLLHVAHRNKILISSLLFNESLKTTDNGTITLNTGIQLTNLPPLQKIHVVDKNERNTSEITERDIINILLCAMEDQHFNVLCFEGCRLPVSVSSSSFTKTLSRTINVSWCPFDNVFHLDLQTGLWEVVDTQVLENIRSSTVYVKASVLQQRSNVQLLYVANNHDILISCLHLEYSSIKIEGDTIMLSSGISLPILPTVEKIHIAGINVQHYNRETLSGISFGNQYRRQRIAQSAKKEAFTEKDILNLFRYGMKCRRVIQLMFDQLQLPTSVSPEALTNIIMTRNIQVRWRLLDIDFHLDFENGHWEVDNTDTLHQLCSHTINICTIEDIWKQTSTITFIHIASSHDIPISCLYLDSSFSKIDAGDVILHSGLRLSCPVTVKKVVIVTEKRSDMTETAVVDILVFVQQSHMLERLEFWYCMLPQFIPVESIPPILKSRNVKVICWFINEEYELNLQSGRWVHSQSRQEITNMKYNHKLERFRDQKRYTECQQARISSERKSKTL